MDRRTFLRLSGATGAAVAMTLTGCRSDVPNFSSNDEALIVTPAALEHLQGTARPFCVGVTDLQGAPLPPDVTVEVYFADATASTMSGTARGPYLLQQAADASATRTVFFGTFDFPEVGFFDAIIVTDGQYGSGVFSVIPAEQSRVITDDGTVLVPGTAALSTQTPTVTDPLGVAALCTDVPTCGMHDHSLDTMLVEKRPIVLLFATPQFCATTVCGPAVSSLETIRQERDWGDVAFIHCEIYHDEPSGPNLASTQLVEAVARWGLPTEPWAFTIDTGGVIQDRIDGPMPPALLRRMVQNVAI